MRIALYQPDIAGNVGTILRTAACSGIAVDVVEPCGSPFSDRNLKRAGMDFAVATAIVLGETLRQTGGWPKGDGVR